MHKLSDVCYDCLQVVVALLTDVAAAQGRAKSGRALHGDKEIIVDLKDQDKVQYHEQNFDTSTYQLYQYVTICKFS